MKCLHCHAHQTHVDNQVADVPAVTKHSCAEKEHHTNTAINQYDQYTDQEYQEDDRHAIVFFPTSWIPRTLTKSSAKGIV
jgi:hypothetical protein